MTDAKLRRDVRILKIYAGAVTLVAAALFAVIFFRLENPRFAEVQVERLEIIEKDGRLRMVLANQERQHPGAMDGVTLEPRGRPPGLLFFAGNGNEVGGLVYDGDKDQGQGVSLTFDKFRGDQTLQLIHEESAAGEYFAGLKVNDQNLPLLEMMKKHQEIQALATPEEREKAWADLKDQGLLMTERVRLGRDRDRSSALRLKDARGRTRLELKVEPAGNARITIYDERGEVSSRWP